MIRIGAVSYLNTKPLVAGLESTKANRSQTGLLLGELQFELSYDLPSHLADQLGWEKLDVALIPSVETFSKRDWTIVSNACIACRGPVWSVKIFSRVPLEQIKTLSLDEGSRTSAALAKILLKRQYSIQPECCSLPIEACWSEAATDAVLVIGDRAMNAAADQFSIQIDLGEWWQQLTGLPFVFAVWAARPGIELDWVNRLLTASRDQGMHSLKAIATKAASQYGLSVEQCLRYFNSNLHFTLGPQEKRALNLFHQYASELCLVANRTELVFHE